MAYLLDNILLFLFWLLMFFFIKHLVSLLPVESLFASLVSFWLKIMSFPVLDRIVQVIATLLIVLLVFSLYILIFLPVALVEYGLKGRSMAKLLLGLRTMSSNGEYPGFGQVLVRTLMRGIEVNSLVALIFIVATPRRQTFYDVLAGTVVIKDFRGKYPALKQPAAEGTAARFTLPAACYQELLLWQRYYLMLFNSQENTPAARDFHCRLAVKRLLSAVPAAAGYFNINGKGGVPAETEGLLRSLSSSLDRGEVQWVSR